MEDLGKHYKTIRHHNIKYFLLTNFFRNLGKHVSRKLTPLCRYPSVLRLWWNGAMKRNCAKLEIFTVVVIHRLIEKGMRDKSRTLYGDIIIEAICIGLILQQIRTISYSYSFYGELMPKITIWFLNLMFSFIKQGYWYFRLVLQYYEYKHDADFLKQPLYLLASLRFYYGIKSR